MLPFIVIAALAVAPQAWPASAIAMSVSLAPSRTWRMRLAIYMDAALDRFRAEGHEVRPEDVARLSPLGFKHINMLGRYALTLPDTVGRGEFRPLRDPRETGVDDA